MGCGVREERLGQSLHGVWDWPALLLFTAQSSLCTGHVLTFRQQVQLIGESCPDRARLSIHRGRKGMQEFHPTPKRLAGCPAQ